MYYETCMKHKRSSQVPTEQAITRCGTETDMQEESNESNNILTIKWVIDPDDDIKIEVLRHPGMDHQDTIEFIEEFVEILKEQNE